MKIHYISTFVDDEYKNDYRVALSASAKVRYICNCVKNIGYDVSLFSPVCSNNGIIGRRCKIIDNREIHLYPYSFGANNHLLKLLSYIFIYLQLFFYILKCVKNGDVVIFYHGIPETSVMNIFCKVLNPRIILEIEELFNARRGNIKELEKEKKLTQKFSKFYIVVNHVISEKIGLFDHNNIAVCEGQYKMTTFKPKLICNKDGVINLLYSGCIEDNGDAYKAIEIAQYLSNKYVIHISGYGSPVVFDKIQQVVKEINKYKERCRIVFHGTLSLSEYDELLHNCSIGLCPRSFNNELSDFEFPSKILMYLSNNMKVVSTPLACFVKSNISKAVNISKSNSAKDLAETVMSISKDLIVDNSLLLDGENERFESEMRKILKSYTNNSV